MDFVKLDDHRDAEGHIKWREYHAAQKANGERCTSCGASILFAKGRPSQCGACDDITESGELRHDHIIRCPWCRYTCEPIAFEDSSLYEAEVCCQSCDKEFTVSVTVSYSYKSPELGNSGNDDDAE